MTDLRTRASEVRPAIAMPTWSSMRNIFCWYDASSPLERCRQTKMAHRIIRETVSKGEKK